MNNIDEFQVFVETTVATDMRNLDSYSTTGLAGEVGELFSALAKYHRGDYSEEEAFKRLRKELGDIQWFICRFATMNGWTMSEVLGELKDKLEDRQEKGTIKGDGDNR